MHGLLNLFVADAAPFLGRAPASDLSETELLARFPALAVACTVLFLIGLACDAYLIFYVAQVRRVGETPDAPLLHVNTKSWGLREVALGALAFVGALLFGNGAALLAVKIGRLGDDASVSLFLGTELVLRVALLTGLIVFFRQRGVNWLDALGLRPSLSRPNGFVLGGLFYFAAVPPLVLVFAIHAQVCRAFGIEPSPQPVAALLVDSDSQFVVGLIVAFAVIVAPLFEEVFFRGFAYPALKQRWGAPRALMMVSGAFALIHLHGPSIAPLFVLAVGLGLAYELTGTLVAPMVMHALFNATNVAMLMFVRYHS